MSQMLHDLVILNCADFQVLSWKRHEYLNPKQQTLPRPVDPTPLFGYLFYIGDARHEVKYPN